MPCGCSKPKPCHCPKPDACPFAKGLVVGQRRVIGAHPPDPKGNQRKNCCCSFFPKENDLFLSCDPHAPGDEQVAIYHCGQWCFLPEPQCHAGDCDCCPTDVKRSCIDCRKKPCSCKPLPPKCFDKPIDAYTCSGRHVVGCGVPEDATSGPSICCYVPKEGDLYFDYETGDRYAYVNGYWCKLPASAATYERPSFCRYTKCKFIVSEKIVVGKDKVSHKAAKEICCLVLRCGDLFVDCETGKFWVVKVNVTADFYKHGIQSVAEELPLSCDPK